MAKSNLANAELVSALSANDNFFVETSGSVRRVPISVVSSPYTEEQVAYGIRRSVSDTSPAYTRIGNMDLHRALPVQSLMRGCLLDDDGNVVEYLPDESWEGATLDGSKGQVMVELPQHYRKCAMYDDGTMEIWLSLYPLSDYQFIPAMYIGAYEGAVQRSTNKLASVKNMDADYRGGNNNADYDDTNMTFLGKAATYISANNFRTYARNRGTAGKNGCGWNSWLNEAQKTLNWFFAVEYATNNVQADYNAELTSDGYHQGGLGAGVTTINSTYWTNFNGQYPVIPIGITDSLGNRSGVVAYTMPEEYEASLTFQVPRYRGVELPYGHIYKWGCDIFVEAHPSEESGGEGDGLNHIFVCKDPAKFATSITDDYTFIGTAAGSPTGGAWNYFTKIVFGTDGEIIGTDSGGSSSTYFCDGHYVNNAVTANTLRAVGFGGSASYGASAGLFCVRSSSTPSGTYAICGSRLCFIPA